MAINDSVDLLRFKKSGYKILWIVCLTHTAYCANFFEKIVNQQSHKYIIETKINRSNLDKTIEKATDQLCSKYLLTERANEGYVIIFDPKTRVGELCTPQKHILEGKEILSFNIGIGR